ncbi:MAG: TIGR04283 family arsenosugar biosynthesis glycosyltransferase [Halomonas subglaciescola]|nr:TIGR04283 family arsenosugar biosynthesis glycosyltransferase [Halomonas subglaciescola]
MPVFNEAATLVAALEALQPLRRRGVELIVVDGESRDKSAVLALPLADTVLTSGPGRAAQMNLGASAADGDALAFLHADTRLPEGALESISQALAGRRWGRFDVTLKGQSRWLGVIAALMNARSRFTGIATGDQAMFMTRAAFAAAGGFPEQPLMEDVALSRQLKKHGKPACLKARVTSSARRWDSHGVWPTVRLMWRLRWRYWRGESPAQLAREYRDAR